MTKRQYKKFIVDDSYKSLSQCPIPILSLDTHIISNMAKWKHGYRLDSISRNREKSFII